MKSMSPYKKHFKKKGRHYKIKYKEYIYIYIYMLLLHLHLHLHNDVLLYEDKCTVKK